MSNKELRIKQIHITFTEKEKMKIEEFAKSSSNTVREFIRNAVFEKIRRLEYPEQFQGNDQKFSPEILDRLLKNSQKTIELQKVINSRYIISKDIDETRELIKETYKELKEKGLQDDYSKEANDIYQLFKAHKSLTPEQVNKKLKIEEKVAILIFQIDDRFKLNPISGRYEIR